MTYHGHLASYLKTQDQNFISKLGFIFHFYNWPPPLWCTARASNTLRWFSYLILPLESLSLSRELLPRSMFLTYCIHTPFVCFQTGSPVAQVGSQTCYISESGLEFLILLPLPSYWDYRVRHHVWFIRSWGSNSPHLASTLLVNP